MEEFDNKKDTIEFGKIVSTHGLDGEMKIYSYTDNKENILKLKKVYINDTPYLVRSIKLFKDMFLLKVESIDSITKAEKFINLEVKREIEPNESNEKQGFFYKDLIGIEVFDIDGKKIGTLNQIFQTGANDVYEVTTANNKNIYIPAIKQVVKKVDIVSKKMIVELMEGLI